MVAMFDPCWKENSFRTAPLAMIGSPLPTFNRVGPCIREKKTAWFFDILT